MAAFIALLLLVVVAAAGFVSRHWLSGRLSFLKDHSKKQEELDVGGVEIVVQNSVHERRLKLSLPILSSVQIRSPVGPMKSSIRSALKELRSRQMVQSLCSRFESRIKVSTCSEADESVQGATPETTQTLHLTRARRRDARDASVAPVLLTSEQTKEPEIATNARSNNLNKFLRSYASNLDNAVTAERRVVIASDAISAERDVVMTTDAEDDIEQPLLGHTEVTTTLSNETFAASDEPGMELELDLHTLELDAEYSNQCSPSPTAGSEEEVSVLVETTDCEPLVDESFGESDEGNNDGGTKRTNIEGALRLSKAFTLVDYITDDVSKHSDPESSQSSDTKPETSSDPPAKAALARFRRQVPSNGRRARHLTTLKL